MAIITLTTDFGTSDEYAGVVKGAILSVNPSAVITDITHHICPQDVLQAACIIKSAYACFPKNTVHVIIVDPGVGTDRAVLAAVKNGYTFLAPDNGVLTLIFGDGAVDAMVKVDNSRYFSDTVSHTFHGRDIFAPVAGHISKGVAIEHLGSCINFNEITLLQFPKPDVKDQSAVGVIISVDRFGNLITNIDAAALDSIRGTDGTVDIRIGREVIRGMSESYAGAGHLKPLAVIGSRGYLEVSVNCGNAEKYFQARKGDYISIQRRTC